MPSSKLYPGELIIDDSTPEHKFIGGEGMSTGYINMFSSPESREGFSSLDPKWIVPKSEYQARCEEMEQTKTRISDHIVQNKIPPKDQKSTNFCWFFAPTGSLIIKRSIQGQKYVDLSASYGASQIKKGKNQGGYGEEAMQWLSDIGVVPTLNCPDITFDYKKYATPENRQLALNYRVDEWDVLTSNSISETASCVFHRDPVAVGYNWWGHEVIVCDPVWLDGELCFRCRNSWGDRPDYPNGFFILRGNKMIPNDAICPRSVTAS